MRERRPIHQGGKDHTSHRLVRGGLSEQKTVVLLAAIAAGLGATSLAYSVLGDYRITLVGVLVTFALLVQFAGFLVDLERGSTSETEAVPGGWMLRTVVLHRRRLLEVLLDFVLISACFAAAYLLVVQGTGTQYQRHVFTVALPAVLITRYIAFILLGLYQGIWRFAGSREAASIVARRLRLRDWSRWGSWWRRRRSATSRSASSCSTRCSASPWSERRGSASARCFRARSTLKRARRPPDADRRRRPLGAEPAPRAARDARRARRRLRRRRPAPASPAAARRARPRRHARHRADPRRRPARHGAGHDPAGARPTASTPSCVPAPPRMSPAGSSGARPTSTPSRCWAPRRVDS